MVTSTMWVGRSSVRYSHELVSLMCRTIVTGGGGMHQCPPLGYATDRDTSCLSDTCIEDDTKAAVRRSPNCMREKIIKYGAKRFSVWRMEFFHPTMRQVALGWHAIEFAQTSAILEFYYWFRFWPHHRAVDMSFCTSLRNFVLMDHPRQKKMTSCRFLRWRPS